MYQPKSVYTDIALKALIHYLEFGDTRNLVFDNIPEELYQTQRACFVSLHLDDGELRGCIGTIDPQEENLVKEITRNAVSAAINDSRFHALEPEELEDITISVDVLTKATEITALDELDPRIFGIVVTDGSFRRGVLLPGLDGIDTAEKQIEIAKRKAGLNRTELEDLTIYRFTSNRYH
ncbi:MAG TPA: AmmeMemoRadiSam system protein A [Bacteroidales bacterium]|nr:AmmeMemoRadiSam system protein A [Bacteroidales bacterium]HRX95708.1 AmmeMemoRadiSam system protein A [Bacteroidales bacterium]